jgi:hypothetical protein
MAENTSPIEELFDPRFNQQMTLAERMHLGMTLADYIQKDPKKEGMKYSYVSHDKVTVLARNVCLKVGVWYAPVIEGAVFQTNGNRAELMCPVRFSSIHDPSDYLDVLGIGYGIDPGDKGPGKAMSYAVKYALLKAFGLETGDDPDQDQDVQHRSTLAMRSDEFEKRLLVVEGDEFVAEMTSPATAEILRVLTEREPAERQRIGRVISRRARELGIDLKTLFPTT